MAGRQYRFRNFSLDPAARELRQGDALVSLPASALDCLVYLIEHRERAVGRDELIAAVWGRADVADTLLAQTVMRVRRTLGDSGSDGAIRTIARFGYRWVEDTAEVEIDAEELSPSSWTESPAPASAAEIPPASSSSTTPPSETGIANTRHSRRSHAGTPRRITTAVLLMLVAAGATFWLLRPDPPSASTTSGPDTVANVETVAPALVLPADVPDTADWRWLRIGLMDLIGNRLREGGLPTAPSETVLAMHATDTAGAAPANGALRITPQARIAGGEWRIRLALSRGSDHATVEAASEDVLQAARTAADLLLVRLGHTPPPGGDLPQPLALDELLQRTRAAILGDQLDLARALIEQAPEPLRTAPAIDLRLAQIDGARGDAAAAERRLLQALDRVAPDSNASLRGRMLGLLGTMRLRLGAVDDAFSAYAEAITVLQSARDPLALAAAYSGRAAVVSQRGDVTAAAADLARAKVEMEAAGDALGIAQVDMNLGVIEMQQNRPVQAIGILRSAETRIAGIGAREELAYVRYALAAALMQALEYDEAATVTTRFWPPEAHTTNVRLRWQLVLARSVLLTDTGHLTDAEGLLQRIERDADVDVDAPVRLQARAIRVLVLHARGLHEDVVTAATPLIESTLADADPYLYVGISHAHLRSLRALGRLDAARAGVEALTEWSARRSDPWRTLHAALAQAEQAWAVDRDAAAVAQLRAAFTQALALAIPEDLIATAAPYAQALLERGEVDEAATVVGRIATWSDRDLRAAWAQAQLYRAQGRTDAWQRSTERLLVLAGERVLPQTPID